MATAPVTLASYRVRLGRLHACSPGWATRIGSDARVFARYSAEYYRPFGASKSVNRVLQLRESVWNSPNLTDADWRESSPLYG